ncbi:MAG: transposase [Pirellulales bacterium]
MTERRRKRVKHFHEPGDFHELTFSCFERRPLLRDDERCRLLASSISAALDGHAFRLYAFVIMPEHVHLLVYPTADPDIGAFVKAIKRPFSFRVKQLLASSGSRLLQELAVQERPGVVTFRFWQEGPGYDRNLNSPKTILASLDYLHLNPVKRGLCGKATDWKWSSARYFLSGGKEVDPDWPTLTRLPSGAVD